MATTIILVVAIFFLVSGSKERFVASGSSHIWALRCPGGPTKVIRSDKKPLSEDQAKSIYMDSFHKVRHEVERTTVWPLVKQLDADSVREYEAFMEPWRGTGTPRGLVEV